MADRRSDDTSVCFPVARRVLRTGNTAKRHKRTDRRGCAGPQDRRQRGYMWRRFETNKERVHSQFNLAAPFRGDNENFPKIV